MKMRRMRSHPDFRLEGRSRHFQSFWELELESGEATARHQHYESEEIIYLVSGEAQICIAEKERAVVPGEVVLVPPRTDHFIANPTGPRVRAITVESRLDLGLATPDAPSELSTEAVEQTVAAQEEASRSARSIEELIANLPLEVDEAVAIKSMVDLFNIGGQVSERIETTIGLENPDALRALEAIERQIMLAVVEITGRYRRAGGSSGRWLQG